MKMLSLFSGIGGIDLAAEWAGVEVVGFCEREPFCQKVLNKHWPEVPIFDDVKTLNKQALEERGIDVGTIGIIAGGFPCQPFSIAGKRKGKEDDRDLWPEMFRIIEEIRPRWVVGENVANFVNMELDRTLSDLESIGYTGQSFVIPACGINAKQQRYRTFVVAHSNSEGLQGRKNTRKEFGKREKSYDKQFGGCSDGNRWWAVEPSLGRVAHGVSNRMDRIRALGNAVVPQQIYPIFKYIMEIERMSNQ